MCLAGTADYTIADIPHWSDEQLQTVLDGHRQSVTIPLRERGEYSGGTVIYRSYFFSQHAHVERARSGSDAWRVEDSVGSVVGTADYTVNYDAGEIRFANDTAGTVYYLWARSYALNAAAAEVWRKKAGFEAQTVDWSSDNHSFKQSQVIDHCWKMVRFYEQEAGVGMSRMSRPDAW